LFRFLETVIVPKSRFEHLLVGQFNLYNSLVSLVENEIKNAKNGLPASIDLKLNSLQDLGMIQLLEKAQKTGVKVRLNVRGLCCLRKVPSKKYPPIPAISIVDRYLEHARVYIFGNAGDPKVYLSSADWMFRNLHNRIETAFPVYDRSIADEIISIFDMQWKDNVKSRILDPEQRNEYKNTNSEISFRSQIETYLYFKRKAENKP
jgi:polyphosphate kinase